ncbi:hypothetical protein HYPSUDRAFT_150051 [Hypholoma sublateritium FD-334 SS-4]|uniref:DUF202 domain-containing protein n=1 Tax=Hypholoma sublateritium (strain FD-334 SS-4) TaxID=945553 RepID=A0A0D2LV73_HYPSF|nr:hypothetical protein HYPSUDRAFT_150051 [Hypholoma sublateritium FD-334 SS-4]
MADAAPIPNAQLRAPDNTAHDSLLRRSWHAILSPFSPSALASLPHVQRPARHLRADAIPETQEDAEHRTPTVRDYHSITSLPPNVRVPKKIPTSIKVEGKVWFANERTWISWLSISVLMGALSLGLFNASKDEVARRFAYVYAVISIAVLIYGYCLYQHRITMIRRRDPGHFDALAGPLLLSAALFVAVLANFIIRGANVHPRPDQSTSADRLSISRARVQYAKCTLFLKMKFTVD